MPNSIESLQWRYATKQYDTTKKLTDDQRQLIIEALRLSPSSLGLQPWKFVHVTNPDTRATLKAAAWNQSAITDASDIFVLCSRTTLDEAYVDAYLQCVATDRNIGIDTLTGYRNMIMGSLTNRTPAQIAEWNARQVYIALGVALTVAAENRIDATPMEGFDTKQFDQILGLTAQGLTSCAVLAVGFRSAEDAYQSLIKSRFTEKDVIINV